MREVGPAFHKPRVKAWLRAICSCGDNEELLERLFCDIMTEQEVARHADRWAVACELMRGSTHSQVAKTLGLASKTVTRVAEWVDDGRFATGGCRAVFRMLGEEGGSPREN